MGLIIPNIEKNKIQVVDLLKIIQLMNVQAHGFKT